MEASRFVGRVAGLAVALGVGSVWLAVGTACADTGADSTASAGSRTHATQARGLPKQPRRQARTAPRPITEVAAAQRDSRRNPALSAPVATPAGGTATLTVPAAIPAAAIASDTTTPGNTDPVEEVTDAALPAATRRGPAAAVQGSAPVTNQVSAQAAAGTSGPITVDPSVTWGGTFAGTDYPGVLVGTLGATSSNPLVYRTVSNPSLGGKLGAVSDDIFSQATLFSDSGEFFYIPDESALYNADTFETFKIRVSEQTPFDTFLASIPVVGLIAPTVIGLLQQLPLVSTLLAPIIGASQVVRFDVSGYELAEGRPTAFTTKVESFDGLMVSANYFPASNVATGEVESAPTVLLGPGLGTPGITNPTDPNGQLGATNLGSLTPGLPVLRDGEWISTDGGPSYTASTGFNVISWDPRGSFATKDPSLPGMQVDAPLFEARDVSALISWLTSTGNPANQQAAVDAGDPLIGMVGGSYGGGIPWTTAATDSRVDAIAPEISWNSLLSALYPNYNQFKTGFGTLLAGILLISSTDVNSQVYQGVLTGDLLGWISETGQAVLASAGPTPLVGNITAPALIFQGVQDILFPLSQSVANAETLVEAGTETKMVWFCGGHGSCNVPLNEYQEDLGFVDNLKWLDRYVVGIQDDTTLIPKFQWYDQLGDYYSSELLPFETGFNNDLYTRSGKGGLLGLLPIIGGSGPGGVEGESPILTIGNASPAWNAINLDLTPAAGSQIVGAPTLNFTYRGLGTSRTVYAQLVDDTTKLVLGNIVTPIPVILDGQERTVDIPLSDIAYTTPQGGSLTLQITSSATNFENFTTLGIIDIGDITIELPIRDKNF